MIFGGRYMLLLMGMFAIYMGFIYNDIISLTLPTFGTSWNVTEEFSYMNHVHPFGLDPQWHNARNSLVFQNSMKMKVSVILGKRAQKSLPSFLLYIYFQGKQNSHK